MKKNMKFIAFGGISAGLVASCVAFYLLSSKNNNEDKLEWKFTDSVLSDNHSIKLEYEKKVIDPTMYVKITEGAVSVYPKDISLTSVGQVKVDYHLSSLNGEKKEEITCDFVVEDTQAPVINLFSDSVDIDTLDGYDLNSNIQSVQDPVDGTLQKLDGEPEKLSHSEDGKVYDAGWYTVSLNDTTVTVHASDNHGNISEKTFKINVSEQPSTDGVQMYSYQPVDLSGLEDPSNWALVDSSDWYYAACTYHSQQYQTPHEALQDVVNHEAERGNTVNVENEARIFCVKDSSGNVLYYEAGFED